MEWNRKERGRRKDRSLRRETDGSSTGYSINTAKIPLLLFLLLPPPPLLLVVVVVGGERFTIGNH